MRKVASLGLIALGITIGALVAVVGIRKSEQPGNPLGVLRARLNLGGPRKAAPPPPESEQTQLYRKYGPFKQSQSSEEWIVRDFFHEKHSGVFVDVGSADYKDGSNTWFLEHDLGWSGVAIDAQASYGTGYQQFRPHTRFVSFFVSDHSNDKVRLFLSASSPFVASSQQKFTEDFGKVSGEIDVQTITLNDLLAAEHVNAFDFLSMDIELAEPKALAGFDIQRFKPALACVEVHPQVRQQILDYFQARGYVVVGKYLRADPDNVWFMPLGSSVTPFPPESKAEEWQK